MAKILDSILVWCNEHIDLFVGAIIGMCLMTLLILPPDNSKTNYDLNNDGVVDIKDMLIVQEYILDNEGCECKE